MTRVVLDHTAMGPQRVCAGVYEQGARCSTKTAYVVQRTPLISFREALPMTPFRRNKLYRMAKNGEIPGARKLGGTWQFHREKLLAWLDCRAP